MIANHVDDTLTNMAAIHDTMPGVKIEIVKPGNTLSNLAAAAGESLPQIEADNPQVLKNSGSYDVIFSGEYVYTGRHRAIPPSLTAVPDPAPEQAAPAPAPVPPPAPIVTSGSDSQNLLTIAQFLVAHGYSKAGAAGIVACIAGESGGNPESVGDGGGGLIGWTPLPAGFVTGNASADLQDQMQQILVYNNNNGAAHISMLNSFSNPVMAADYYSQTFERPAVVDSDVVQSVANSVFAALGG